MPSNHSKIDTAVGDDVRYAALRAHDRRFDGTFFVAVRTTRIYCRPVCRARMVQRRNCTFFDTAAEAETHGYRPCLRCRPELAPGRARVDAHARLANAAYARIAAGALNHGSIADLARALCVGERQLRRAVRAQFGVTPIELAQTQRLHIAKQLLTETDLPVARIAYASGFASLSRFNTLFLDRYRLSPTRLRQNGRARARSAAAGVKLLFGYRPPLAWETLLSFLAGRAIPGVEHVDATSYTRTIRFGEHSGWFSVRQPRNAEAVLEVEVAESLLPVLMPLRAGIRRLFDLDAEPQAVAQHFADDAVLGPLVQRFPGLRLPGAADGFELAMRGVLGQQISVAAARTLAGRLVVEFGEPIADAPAGLDHLPIRAEALADATPERVSKIGLPLTRARTLVELARAVVAGDVSFAPTNDIDAMIAALRRVPGIGAWTAEYIAMRGLHWPDAFPATDLGIRKALNGIDAARAAEAWRPWRSYATLYLWMSLTPKENS